MLLTLMVSMATNAQGILGTVTDEFGEPVIGASVVEKGNPQNGSITDFEKAILRTVALPTLTESSTSR